MADDDNYRCKSSFAYWVKGQPCVVAAGVLVGSKDPAFKANPDAFESVGAHVEAKRSRVESATKAPGEVRAVEIPKGK